VSAVESSGTLTTTPGTEQTLNSPSTLHSRILTVDTTALSGTEYVELRIKGPVLSGGAAGIYLGPVTFPAGLTAAIVQLPAVLQTQGGDITLRQVNGSARSIPWAIATID
jgi:hypothetical protein